MIKINDGWDVADLVMHSAFDELHQASGLAFFPEKVEEIEPKQCFFISNEMIQRQGSLRKHLVKVTVLFQAGMESLIYYYRTKYPEINKGNPCFVKKWDDALAAKGISPNFNEYASFYKDIRIALTHPDRPERIDKINSIGFLSIYQGIKSGWEAEVRLASALGRPHDKNSWETMCAIHQVPIEPLDHEYPDLINLISTLRRRHLKELNAN
ncbi:hypothetical protein ACFL19_01860 [Pseudomonadota bacterium]